MSDPLGYESLETCCGFLYDDDQMCLSSKRGCLGIRIKMSIFIFLRSCSVAHTGPELLDSGDHEVSGPKCWDFRYTPLCQTQRFTSPKLPLPTHTHTHQYNVHPLKHQHQETGDSRKEPALRWLVSVDPNCPSQGSSQAPGRRVAVGGSSGSAGPQETEAQLTHPVLVLPPL